MACMATQDDPRDVSRGIALRERLTKENEKKHEQFCRRIFWNPYPACRTEATKMDMRGSAQPQQESEGGLSQMITGARNLVGAFILGTAVLVSPAASALAAPDAQVV